MKDIVYNSILILMMSGTGCGQVKNNKILVVRGDSAAAMKLITDTNRATLTAMSDTTLSRIKVFGRHWFSNNNGKADVRFLLNGEVLKDIHITYLPNNTFMLTLPYLFGVRDCVLTASQEKGSSSKKTAEIHFTTRMQKPE